jgi:hypothetical protein
MFGIKHEILRQVNGIFPLINLEGGGFDMVISYVRTIVAPCFD